MKTFNDLRSINVNEHTEKKSGLTYLTWSWAWDVFKQKCPDATYDIIKTDEGLPYFESRAGAMVYTRVNTNGVTHEMWLPVMDGANKAMKSEPYTYRTSKGEKTVEAFTMFDINKTIMRCLVKNLAMFGLGLYIYAGEDLPSEDVTVDVSAWLQAIVEAKDMATLQTQYTAAYSACKRDQAALAELIAAKDIRKAQLTEAAQ